MLKIGMVTIGMGALVALSTPAFAKKGCHYIKGNGWGLTKELAEANAKMAHGYSLATYGGKARGKVRSDCKFDGLMQMCVARQVACKTKA
jgi:hypothetical protein